MRLERCRYADGQAGRHRARAFGVRVVGIGQGFPGFGIEWWFIEFDQFEPPQQRCRRPVVEQHRFATADRRRHLGIQCGTGPGAEVDVAGGQVIGLEFLAVDDFRSPAGRAVEEASAARVFGVTEHVLVLRQVGNGFQLRGQGLDAALRIALDHVLRHPPAFGGALDRIAKAEHLALRRRLDPGGTASGPLFTDDLDVVFGQRRFKADGAARQRVGRVAVTFFNDQAQDFGDEAAAFPSDVAKMDRRRFFRGRCRVGQQAQGQQRTAEQGFDRSHADLLFWRGRFRDWLALCRSHRAWERVM
ncbi:hypothetical protein D3C85_1000440 [compost metagenome]